MHPNVEYRRAKCDLALALWGVRAVLVAALHLDHPLIVRRTGPRGEEFGFPLKTHEADSSRQLSPYYFNLRTPKHPNNPGPLTPEIVDLAAQCMVYATREVVFDGVAGLPHAGDPLAASFVRQSAAKELIRLIKFEHGATRCIGGLKDYNFNPMVRTVLPIDDVISAGDSKDEALHTLRNSAFEINNLAVLVDRQEGGRERMAALGCEVHEVFTAGELFRFYADAGKIKQGAYGAIKAYLASVSPA